MDITFHYPPDLIGLLIDTIPLLNKTKNDVFLFFRGAGVSEKLMQAPLHQWKNDKASIHKFEIARQILTELNLNGEKSLRERREVLKRVVEFESFSSCWPADQLKARGLISEIQKVVKVKDSFTRMANERDLETQTRRAQKQQLIDSENKRKNKIDEIKTELFALFNESDRSKRGKSLEKTLNSLFEAYGILVRSDFALTGDQGEGIIEQIDGVIELDNHVYFVELKWWKDPVGVPEISQHLVRVYHRAEGRAIIISASGFTRPAVSTCKEALQQKVVVLCSLQEIVMLLEGYSDFCEFFRKKVHAAMIDRNPYLESPHC
jgi:restriction endonuclease Mrr